MVLLPPLVILLRSLQTLIYRSLLEIIQLPQRLLKLLTTHYTITGAGSASGGSVIFTAGNIPASGETVVLRRAVPQTQAIDYIANDPFPAESHEEGLDRAMMTLQQVQEEVTRSIKLSRTNTMTSTEFTVSVEIGLQAFLINKGI
jgi:hypothetical protein